MRVDIRWTCRYCGAINVTEYDQGASWYIEEMCETCHNDSFWSEILGPPVEEIDAYEGDDVIDLDKGE